MRSSLDERLRRWHRLASLVLVAQWSLWVLTALGMTLVPRAWTTAYRTPAVREVTAGDWPTSADLSRLVAAENARRQHDGLPALTHVRVHNPGGRVVASARTGEDGDATHLHPRTGERLDRLSPDEVAAVARAMTGEPLRASAVSLVTRNSAEHQKLPVPVWRVQAAQAALFFDPVTGGLVAQATWWKWWENLLKSIHTLDPTGNADFHASLQLTLAALLFLLAAFAGVLSVRRFLVLKRGARTVEAWSYRWHQTLGVLIAVQVVLQVSSGLSVVWLLQHPTIRGDGHTRDVSRPIRVADLHAEPPCCGRAVTLTMLLDEPVYRVEQPGPPATQTLYSAVSGRPRPLTDADRDAVARQSLIAPDSIVAWNLGTRLDEQFFAGPFPAWKATYTAPNPGTLAIDAVTGRVHLLPRTGRYLFIEDFYKLHVASYDMDGVIRYRLEPTTLTLIGLVASMVVTGLVLQVARLRRGRW